MIESESLAIPWLEESLRKKKGKGNKKYSCDNYEGKDMHRNDDALTEKEPDCNRRELEADKSQEDGGIAASSAKLNGCHREKHMKSSHQETEKNT